MAGGGSGAYVGLVTVPVSQGKINGRKAVVKCFRPTDSKELEEVENLKVDGEVADPAMSEKEKELYGVARKYQLELYSVVYEE